MKYINTMLFLLVVIQVQAGTIRRVKANEFTSGNGLSWNQAYPGSNLQAVINMSVAGDEVWLAAGTYQPASGAAYSMKSGVKIYGGFAGAYSTDVTRDPKLYPTILKGNSFVVFNNNNVDGQAVLDGLTVRDGTNTTTGYQGGGMYNFNSSPQINNVSFIHNVCDGGGGGMCNTNSSPKLTNVIFDNNITGRGEGGAIYNDNGSPTLTNVVFYNNYAPHGGAVSNNDGSNSYFYNCFFYKNHTYADGFGGAVENNTSSTFNVYNSTFVGNYCSKDNIGGAIHSFTPSGQTASAICNVYNCAFWNNYDTLITGNNATKRVDISVFNATINISYSYFKETSIFSGAGNITTTSTVPFKDVDNAIGADGLWMTTDDGLRPDVCKNSLLIDKGNNSNVPGTLITDIAGQTRRVLVGLITPSGGSPVVDMGAYEAQETATRTQITGAIGNGHTIPYPQELFPDFVTSTTAPIAGATVVRWENRAGTTGSWSTTTGLSPVDSIGYRLPLITPPSSQYDLYYRRVVKSAAYCNIEYATDSVLIHMVASNGTVSGKVNGLNGITGVQGVIVKLERITTGLSGSPNGKVYLDTTDADGTYGFPSVYYGDPFVPSSSAQFKISATRSTDRITPGSNQTLTYNSHTLANINFTDSTGYNVGGMTFQRCINCQDSATATPTQCPIDSIDIWRSAPGITLSRITSTGYISGVFGSYTIKVDDPGNVVIEPRFPGHVFAPLNVPFYLTKDTFGINFRDTTVHTISGKLMAGCGEFVGTGVLEFYDSLPRDSRNNVRAQGCFKKRVTTKSDGSYSIKLPARPYKVKLISFIPSGPTTQPVQGASVLDFVNRLLPADSLYRDITTHDTVLNIVYERDPVIRITRGLNLITCPSPLGSFSIVEQTKAETLRIKVFQGLPYIGLDSGCMVSDTNKVRLLTNVPSNTLTNLSPVDFRPVDTGVVVVIKGGAPNVTGYHFKTLEMNFKDKYNRVATLSRANILVTGVRQDDGANFFTVAPPKIPMLVLHDPPGDQSYSYWTSTQSKQTAFRMYAASGSETGGWVEVKLGTKLETGIFVSTESEIWATAGAEIKDAKTNTTATEQIYTHKYTTDLKTSDTEAEVGADGDLYVGMALNLIYTKAREISYQGCLVKDTVTMIFAPGGVPTEFRTSEKQLKTVVIPGLQHQLDITTIQKDRDSIKNVIGQWQQMITNNAHNKEQAKSTGQNITFNGGGSSSGSSLTTTISDINTTEFTMNVDRSLALSAGFEVAGSGASIGGTVSFKVETGESRVQDITTEVSTGYELRDKNSGDQFTLNVKEDRLSGTPVFELLAGQASCPSEEGAQLRDQPQFSAPITIARDTNQVGTLEYKLYLSNPSPITTDASRTYNVYVDGASNSDGALVTINNNSNTSANATFAVPVQRGQQQLVTVRIQKVSTSPVFSYTGINIIATDACSSPLAGDIADTVSLSAYFTAPCSNITLADPGDNWVLSGTEYRKQILVKGYDRTKISTVNLQYALAGSSNWTDAYPILTPDSLNSNPNVGTNFFWNTTGLADSKYVIRLKLVCPSGIVYSEKLTGVIDHTAPALLGKPSPTDDNYVNGDVISFNYNEDIAANRIDTNNVSMTRLLNGVATPIPITVTVYRNGVVIVPVNSINGFVHSVMRMVAKNIPDVYGNIKTTPDTSYFLVDTTIIATGTDALKVFIAQQKVSKNSDSTINIIFKLPVQATDSIRVNYTIGGTARMGTDYQIEYTGYQPSYTYASGTQGAIRLPKSSSEVTFKIRPIGDTALAPDKTVTISLSEGGNYSLGDTTSRTGIITSDDGISTYTFTGTGNFSDKNNWLNGKKPLTTLVSGKTIIISPSGTCTLDVPLKILPGATLRVTQNRSFIIPGNLRFN